jgi:hypothetical protein
MAKLVTVMIASWQPPPPAPPSLGVHVPSDPFPSGFLTKLMRAFLVSPSRATLNADVAVSVLLLRWPLGTLTSRDNFVRSPLPILSIADIIPLPKGGPALSWVHLLSQFSSFIPTLARVHTS